MALVMNASSKDQTVMVHGSWFTFKPQQIKELNDDKVHFLCEKSMHLGFVAVPEELADLDARSSAEGKKKLEALREQGISNRIRHLEWLRNNEMRSLRKDMDKQNIKAEVESEMTGDSFSALSSALKELAGYKTKTNDTVKDRAAALKELNAALTEE